MVNFEEIWTQLKFVWIEINSTIAELIGIEE